LRIKVDFTVVLIAWKEATQNGRKIIYMKNNKKNLGEQKLHWQYLEKMQTQTRY
jgi:hypothetical protein